ncbi:leukocyte elastase inhibitor-like [Eriocheir sinensis]|uniref:leukocyte elastase inhibitor-like n=1 Tax=Eriocheir sinensis TaxID=95602 RepID=UPI0021C6153A|nr:leukocyte elastase inhibitor-like [Eriocheir sinensis]XP_050701536.1 leukocyte elastase inhibitor-like [Eriocheir sinensis]
MDIARGAVWAVWVGAGLVAAVVVAVMSCMPVALAAPSPSVQSFSMAHFGFTLDLYTALVSASGKEENVLFSSVGLAAVLSPLLGSDDRVISQQIRQVLRYSNMSIACVEKGHTDMLNHFENVYYDGVLQLGYTVFLPPSAHATSALYPEGTVQLVDFLDNATAVTQRVNEWVSGVTEGRVGPVGSVVEAGQTAGQEEGLAVVALAFSGRWLHGFQPELTFDKGLFYTTPQERFEIPMMVGRLELPLGSYPPLEVRVLELPLAARRASMFILLPDHPERGLEPLEHNMTQNNMKALFSSLKDERVNLRLPRFRVALTQPLKAALTSLGLTHVLPQPLHDIHHRLLVEVTEGGENNTHAQDSRAEQVGTFGDKYFEVDHPFVFFVWDYRASSVLVMARIVSPEPILVN